MAVAEAIEIDFRFLIDYVDRNGNAIRQQAIKSVDFGHAVRCVAFDAFRRGLTDQYPSDIRLARVEPLFAVNSEPSTRTHGFRVTVPLPGDNQHHLEFGISYFRSHASRLRAELIRTDAGERDTELFFQLHALLDRTTSPQTDDRLAICFDRTTELFQVDDDDLGDLGPIEAWDNPDQDDVRVLVERCVLAETVAEARDCPNREVGGFLLGKLCRESGHGNLFVKITTFVSSAGTTESSNTSVTFTPASFAAVRSIIRLRDEGESVVGWYHSHPFAFCGECPLPTPPECVAKVLFYSNDDMHLMESTFEQPFMVGLLAGVEPRLDAAVCHLPVKLYGWRSGRIEPRGFEVFRAANC